MTPFYNKDGHIFLKHVSRPDTIFHESLVISYDNPSDEVKYIKANGIKSIIVNPNYFKGSNLDFLQELSDIESVGISTENFDLAPLHYLSCLRSLRLDKPKSKVDFSLFTTLEVLGTTYSKLTINISSCKNLFWLWLDNFSEENLHSLDELTNLKYLTLYKSSIADLEGIEKMEMLVSLMIDTATKLTSLKGIDPHNKKLEVLDIHGAKKLNNYEAIANAQSLRKLFLSRTGETPNISFLKNLPVLEQVTIGMKVIDGDMSFLKAVPKPGFVPYPHYNRKTL